MMIDTRLIGSVPQSKKYVALTVALKVASLLANTALIFALSHAIQRAVDLGGPAVIFSHVRDFAPALCVALCSVAVGASCAYAASLASFYCSRSVKKTLRSMIYEKLLRLGAQYHEQAATAKIVQLAVEGVEQLEVWFGSYLPQFFFSMIAAVVTFGVLCFLNVRMAVILLVCVPLIPVSIVIVQKIAKRLLGQYWGQYANLADNFLENMQGLSTLQLFGADGERQRQMDAESEHFRKVTMKVLSMQLNSIIIMDMVAYGGAGLGIAAAVGAFRGGSLSLGACVACILISADFFIPLRRLGSLFHTAMNGTTACKNIFALLDTAEKPCGTALLQNAGSALGVECDGLGYSFDGRDVLRGCGIQVEPGSFVAFVGKSGSGKSTAAKVIAGIYKDYSGSVKVGGMEVRGIQPESLYKNCVYISHRDWIFKGTVRDTLNEGKRSATDGEMWAALEQVRLADFVRDAGGLCATIEENAANLSGGQKQRLSIARALLHGGGILIFDEATSNIDVESESAILQLLRELKGKKTIVMISHRAESCADADATYQFADGTCTKVGSAQNGGRP